MIKFLVSLQKKKLELKYEEGQRRIVVLQQFGQLNIALSSNEYTKNVLKDYSTKSKVHRTDDELVDTLVYTTTCAFINKSTRVSTMMYKNKGAKLIQVLHIICASVDSNTKIRAKMTFINCRILLEETAIIFLTRLA